LIRILHQYSIIIIKIDGKNTTFFMIYSFKMFFQKQKPSTEATSMKPTSAEETSVKPPSTEEPSVKPPSTEEPSVKPTSAEEPSVKATSSKATSTEAQRSKAQRSKTKKQLVTRIICCICGNEFNFDTHSDDVSCYYCSSQCYANR
jgi:DNA-directed RNA polymerase subunit RPC12/RpoP